MSSRDLIDAVEDGDWDYAMELMQGNNVVELVEYTNSWNKNALHWAFINDAPFDIIRAMLGAHSEIAPLQKDKEDGFTPLHVAIEYNSKEFIVTMLIFNCPRAALIANIFGQTPLHLALFRNKSNNIISLLLDANPTAATVADHCGKTPLHMVFERLNIVLRVRLHSIGGDKNAIENIVGHLYEIALLLLQAATHGTIRGNQSLFRPFHAAIMNPICPLSFVKLILKMDPMQASQWDQGGNLPIHIAAAAKSSFDGELYKCNECIRKIQKLSWYQHENYMMESYCRSCFQKICLSEGERRKYTAIKSVDKIPEVIRCVVETNSIFTKIPNCEGRLPFHIAIENGKLFDQGVEAILQAAPRALNTRDIKTHLYPFMLTAVKHDRDANKLQKLTLCFAMLAKNPHLVSSGIMN